MNAFEYTFLIPGIPLLGFLIIIFNFNRFSKNLTAWLATASIGISFLLSVYTSWQYFFQLGPVNGVYPKFIGFDTHWLRLGENLSVHMGTLIDQASVMMLIVVTTVSLMVHIYSIGYMHDDRGFNRFFAFLQLFSFSMLSLVMATNVFQIYIFWELVGVSSFLLIGFYYEKPSAVAASKKAFIVTRFADLFFLLGILLLSFHVGTFDFISLTNPDNFNSFHLTGPTLFGLSIPALALILIFIGGAGKSAMFPLHIWLPDAMEGPSPVSALIHAATMVVAGVYLVARLFANYAFMAPEALVVVGYVGAFTSLFAAIIAITQIDFKRVLAFSTISQIGYMMAGLGVSGFAGEDGLGYMASMFHLFTHAMFKALLFLGAGAVIHAVHTNSIREMGGLRRHMKITHVTFLVATLAIAGFPGLSGFFSKDEIITAAHMSNPLIYITLLIVAGLTAFYMFRLYFLVFWNAEPHYHHKPHDPGKAMLVPLIVLGILSIVTGYIPFGEFVSADGRPLHTHLHLSVALISTLVSFTGIALAWLLYKKPSDLPARLIAGAGALYRWAYNKFYIDEIYLFITRNIIFAYISRPIAWFDRHVVDGTMNAIGWVTVTTSEKIKGLQSGQLQKYAFAFVSALLVISALLVYFLINN